MLVSFTVFILNIGESSLDGSGPRPEMHVTVFVHTKLFCRDFNASFVINVL